MNLFNLRDALLTVVNEVYHFESTEDHDHYIVWSEDGSGLSLFADDRLQNQSITGTIDYFTKEEYDLNFDKIQEALTHAEISFRLNSIQYEIDTNYHHYEWIFELG